MKCQKKLIRRHSFQAAINYPRKKSPSSFCLYSYCRVKWKQTQANWILHKVSQVDLVCTRHVWGIRTRQISQPSPGVPFSFLITEGEQYFSLTVIQSHFHYDGTRAWWKSDNYTTLCAPYGQLIMEKSKCHWIKKTKQKPTNPKPFCVIFYDKKTNISADQLTNASALSQEFYHIYLKGKWKPCLIVLLNQQDNHHFQRNNFLTFQIPCSLSCGETWTEF